MSEPMIIYQKQAVLPWKELEQSWNLGAEEIGVIPCFCSMCYMATSHLQLLKRSSGHTDETEKLLPFFKHQQMRDDYPVLLHSLRCDLF